MMKPALFVIDYIKGITEGNGSCAQFLQEHPEIIDNTNKLIELSHKIGIPIFHIRLAFDPNYRGLPKHAPSAKMIRENQQFQLNTQATEFISRIKIYSTDGIINKTYGDVFHGNNLITALKKQSIDSILFTGVATDNAILFSTNTAILNDFLVIVVKDACGAPSQESHDNALKIMTGRTASAIISTEEAIKRL